MSHALVPTQPPPRDDQQGHLVSQGQSPQPKRSLRRDPDIHPHLQRWLGMVCGDSCCSGPGHPEQRSEHEGAVAGTSRGGRVEGRPAEGLGGPLGLGADSFVLHANHAARGAGNSAGRTPPPRPPTGKGRGRHAGHPGRSDPGRGHRWQAGSPAHPDQSGTSLLGGGSEGRKGCTDWTCLALGQASAHSLCLSRQGGEA